MHAQPGHELSKVGQIMVLRAIAVAIVLEETMLPNQELLLRHTIQCFNMRGSSLQATAVLDDAETFLEVLPTLAADVFVLCVHLLCQMFDLDRKEFDYWQ